MQQNWQLEEALETYQKQRSKMIINGAFNIAVTTCIGGMAILGGNPLLHIFTAASTAGTFNVISMAGKSLNRHRELIAFCRSGF